MQNEKEETKELLEVVDENDVVIGLEDRNKIHEEGLLHREIHIWFFTPEKEIIFQHRAKDKDTYPDLLDATVGGHVEPGDSYEQTAIKESLEETGLELKEEDFIFLKKMNKKVYDNVTNKINNTLRVQYAYLYKGGIEDLQIEEGKAIAFVKIPLDKILNLTEEEKKKSIPSIIEKDFLEMYTEAVKKLNL